MKNTRDKTFRRFILLFSVATIIYYLMWFTYDFLGSSDISYACNLVNISNRLVCSAYETGLFLVSPIFIFFDSENLLAPLGLFVWIISTSIYILLWAVGYLTYTILRSLKTDR